MGTEAGSRKSALVVSAHAADFVWRSAGAIATAVDAGWSVGVLCLTFGERGESQALWKEPGMTVQRVKDVRRGEAEKAATILGAEVEFLDADDYPLRATDAVYDAVVGVMRRRQPSVILTHAASDPYNLDHSLTHELVLRARMIAQAQGHDPGTRPLGAAQVLQFEPHQPEQCGFVPNHLLDITAAFARKSEAMHVMEAQGHLLSYYTDLAKRRGVQAVRNGGRPDIVYAEAFQRVFPTVSAELA